LVCIPMNIVESLSKYVENSLTYYHPLAYPELHYYQTSDERTIKVNVTAPHNGAAISVLDEREYPTFAENCWTDSRMPQRRLATHGALCFTFSSSTSLVKVMTAMASGTASSAWRRARCSVVRLL
jgi:hypothetical protein